MGALLCLITVGLSVTLCDAVEEPTDNIWAVLVAGSSGYDNYRHQASICHAYQILHRHGVPDSQIIVMMYDDIAQNPENPLKGQIFNRPGGRNVYENVPKDYTGEAVNSANFIHVLTGNSTAMKGIGSGKVLKSGRNDHVFVNFVDHGSTGLVLFPSTRLYADDLLTTLQTMYKQQMYKKLVIYLASCQSGSMFKHILPNNISAFAFTATNSLRNSLSCNWDDSLQNYLSDAYSTAWMEDIDSKEFHGKLLTETLEHQMRHVVEVRAKQGRPSIYGDLNIKDDHVVDFLGQGNSRNYASYQSPLRTDSPVLERFGLGLEPCCSCKDQMSNRHVALVTLAKRISLTEDASKAVLLRRKRETLLRERKMVDQLFKRVVYKVAHQTSSDVTKLVRHHSTSLTLDMMPCYRSLVENFSKDCVNINKNPYTLNNLYQLANMCALQDLHIVDVVLQVFAKECTKNHQDLTGVE